MNKTPEKGIRWQSLMIEAQRGNNDAYKTLLSEVQDYASGYCYNRLKNHAVTADTVQEILISLHKYRHTYNPKKPFLPWLVTLMKHKVIDTVRAQVRRFPESTEEELLDVQGSTAAQDRTEASSCLEIYLAELGEHYRDAIVLTKIQGYSIADTAKSLGISEESVKVRVHRGLKELKKIANREMDLLLQERM